MHVELAEIQEAERNILWEFIAICQRHGLNYYLAEGTLLGAVRHQDMIPWDDDIDVALFREDYEQLLKYARAELPEHMHCLHTRWTEGYKECMAKIIDDRYTVDSWVNGENRRVKLWIDIFVIDGMPASFLGNRLHRTHLLASKLLVMWSDISYYVMDHKRSPLEKLLIAAAKVLHTDRWLDGRKQMLRLDRVMASVPVSPKHLTVNFISEYKFLTECPMQCYGSGRMALFHGRQVQIPRDAERLLEAEYGDYKKLPPEDKRYKHRLRLVRGDEKRDFDGRREDKQ